MVRDAGRADRALQCPELRQSHIWRPRPGNDASDHAGLKSLKATREHRPHHPSEHDRRRVEDVHEGDNAQGKVVRPEGRAGGCGSRPMRSYPHHHAGLRFTVSETGAGRPMLFQHGLCGDAAQPADVFPPASGWRCLTLECRGHGHSEAADGRGRHHRRRVARGVGRQPRRRVLVRAPSDARCSSAGTGPS